MNNIDTKARTGTGKGGFDRGVARAMATGSGNGAGGSKLTLPFPTEPGGEALNKGRLNGGTEVHYDKQPVPSIANGAQVGDSHYTPR